MSAEGVVELGYGVGAVRVTVPAGPFATLAATPPPPLADPAAALRAALDAPIGAPPLRALVRGGDRATIVVSDATRATGIRELLPALLGYLDAAGIPAERVRLLAALGMHRAQSAAERAATVGPEVAARVTHLDHACDDTAMLEPLASDGPLAGVHLNRQVLEGDLAIVTGTIAFHYLAGFGGGRKALLPGVAARESVRAFHRRSLADAPAAGRHVNVASGVRAGNPLDALACHAAAAVPRTFLVNTIMTPADGGRVAALAVGDVAAAFDRGCDAYRGHFAVTVPARRPVVVVSAGGAPRDCDLVQTQKAIGAGAAALAPGGMMLVIAACADGPGQPELLEWFAHRDRARHVAALRERFSVPGQTALALREHAAHGEVHLYSRLPPDVVTRCGMIPVAHPDEFFAAVARRYGTDVDGYLLPEGARYLPVVAATP